MRPGSPTPATSAAISRSVVSDTSCSVTIAGSTPSCRLEGERHTSGYRGSSLSTMPTGCPEPARVGACTRSAQVACAGMTDALRRAAQPTRHADESRHPRRLVRRPVERRAAALVGRHAVERAGQRSRLRRGEQQKAPEGTNVQTPRGSGSTCCCRCCRSCRCSSSTITGMHRATSLANPTDPQAVAAGAARVLHATRPSSIA